MPAGEGTPWAAADADRRAAWCSSWARAATASAGRNACVLAEDDRTINAGRGCAAPAPWRAEGRPGSRRRHSGVRRTSIRWRRSYRAGSPSAMGFHMRRRLRRDISSFAIRLRPADEFSSASASPPHRGAGAAVPECDTIFRAARTLPRLAGNTVTPLRVGPPGLNRVPRCTLTVRTIARISAAEALLIPLLGSRPPYAHAMTGLALYRRGVRWLGAQEAVDARHGRFRGRRVHIPGRS